MSGILANSASMTMTGGDTATDKAVSGYVCSEQITLSVTPSGSSYSWGLSKPAGATGRSDLNDATSASPVFTPDVAGYYVLTCLVDGATAYVLRAAVTHAAVTTAYEAIRFSPIADSRVAAPALGCCLFWSATQNALAVKLPDDSIATVGVTPVP